MAQKRKGTPTSLTDGGETAHLKKQKEVTVDVRDWAELNNYFLEDVMQRLPLVYCLSLICVCKSWRTIGANYLDKCDRRVPLLVRRGQNEVTTRNCHRILGNSNFEMDLPQAYGSCIWGSFQDWLFLGRRKKHCLEISLLNPFTGENITLPTTSLRYCSMIMSAVPTDKKCICLLVCENEISFWTPGAVQWHTVPSQKILDALYYRGCFYLMCEHYGIVVIDEENMVGVLGAGASLLTRSLPIESPGEFGFTQRHFLVESCGEILLVYCSFKGNRQGYLPRPSYQTYRLDLDKMEWLRLRNPEDEILLVGSSCSRSFPTKDLGKFGENKVYMADGRQGAPTNEWDLHYKLARIVRGNDDDWAGVWLSAPIGWCLKHKCLD